MKTAMLFTIALAYLVFGGSSLLLIGNLILGFIKNFVGSDVLISSFFSSNDLPETDLRGFLDGEIGRKTDRIEMYAFRGKELSQYLKDALDDDVELTLNSGGDFPDNEVRLYPVEETFIDSSLIDYYIPKYGQSDVNFQRSQGKPDYVKSLYSDEGIEDYGDDLDPYDVESKNLTAVDSSTLQNYTYSQTQQIKVILPEGIKTVLSINGGDTIRLSVDQKYFTGPTNYRCLVRGLPQKMPGFFFMSYKQVQFFLQGVISFPQAAEMAYFASYKNPEKRDPFLEYSNSTALRDATYNYPKDRLSLRLNSKLKNNDDERNTLV